MRIGRYGALIAPILAFALILGAACNDDDNDVNDVNDVTPTNGVVLEIAAENEFEFTEDELRAPAGEITIVFDNRDEGILHNIAIYPSQDDLATVLGSTELTEGPDVQELTIELEAGEYYYNCQVHPAMDGTLIVE
jgi:plastocyanin